MFLVSSLNARTRRIKRVVLVFLFFVGGGGTDAFARSLYTDHDLRSVEKPRERQVRELREQEVNQLRIALGRRAPENRRADLYQRLSEIYREAYQSEFLLEGRVHERRLDQGLVDPQIDRTHSLQFLRKGIQACHDVLRLGISYEKLDEIYFSLGFYYGELDQTDQSIEYYQYLVNHYPSSPLLGAADQLLGEIYYRKSNYSVALDYFKKAVQKIPSDRSPPILHKMAWCYYRTRQFDQAVSTLKTLVSQVSHSQSQYAPLKDEALRDLAVFMTEIGQVEEAIEYLQAQTGNSQLYPQLLEKLAAQYERRVEIQKAKQVYESLMQSHPSSPAAVKALAHLVEIDLKQGQYKSITQRLAQNPIPQTLDSESEDLFHNLRVSIRKLATENHQNYRKQKDHRYLEAAHELYLIYIQDFLKRSDPHRELPEIQIYLAEIKKEKGQSAEAVDLYRKVIASQDSRFMKEAQIRWADALAELLKKAPEKNHTDSPRAMEEEYIEASDLMQQTLGDTEESHSAALHAAQLLAAYPKSWSRAIERVKKIIHQWPNSQQALTAAGLWLQIYLDHQKSPGLDEPFARVIHTLMEQDQLLAFDQKQNHGKLKAALHDHALQLKVDEITEDEKAQNFSSAAQKYLNFAESVQDRDLAEKSFASAIQSLLRSQVPASEFQGIFRKWSSRYPHSKSMMESLRQVATYELVNAEFEDAAQTFFELGKKTQGVDALETSARLFEALSQISSASQAWSSLLSLTTQAEKRSHFALKLALAHEKMKLDSDSVRFYKLCADAKTDLEAECGIRLAQLYLKNQDFSNAQHAFRRVAALKHLGKRHRVSPYVGFARYELAQAFESQAEFQPLRLPEVQLQKAVAQRLEFIEPLTKSYQSAMEVGGPWAIASLNRLALWLNRFADEVDQVSPPSTYQKDSIARFKKSLAAVSVPLREKARTVLQKAYSKAEELEILSPALPEIVDDWVHLGAQGVAQAQGVMGEFQFAGSISREELKEVRTRLMKNTQDFRAWSEYGMLLWLEKKPALALFALEKALNLNPRDSIALNNWAVITLLSGEDSEWVLAAKAKENWLEALKQEEFFNPSKLNLAILFNYYRLFSKSKALLNQVRVNGDTPWVRVNEAIALQGLGKVEQAIPLFQELKQIENPKKEFIQFYHAAVRRDSECLTQLNRIDLSRIQGLELSSYERLKRFCEHPKNQENP